METQTRSGPSVRTIILIIAGVAVAIIAALGLFVYFILTTVNKMMVNSGAYQQAIVLVDESDAVTDRLGEPIEQGRFTTGSISTSGNSGQADLAIPLTGPDGRGTANVRATKFAGEWEINRLVVTFKDGSERVVLVE